jgi:hypothetical protein
MNSGTYNIFVKINHGYNEWKTPQPEKNDEQGMKWFLTPN